MKGLASNMHESDRGKIFELIYKKSVPGNRDPLSLVIKGGKIAEYKDQDISKVERVYMTKAILKDVDIVSNWIKSGQNVIIVGK